MVRTKELRAYVIRHCISSLGKHGHEDQALMFFDLLKIDGIAPDGPESF